MESNTGLIRLKSNLDLTTDRVSTYVARVVASDGGFPSRSATATVLISVLRNLFSPVFSNFNFLQRSILETVPVGTFIVDLNATDADKSVRKYACYEVGNYFEKSACPDVNYSCPCFEVEKKTALVRVIL